MSAASSPADSEPSSATRELLATIEGPLLHDVQGALGVIRLATQLLDESTENPAAKASHSKILNACRRLSWRIEDLRAQLLVRLDEERVVPADAGSDWAVVVQRRLVELGQDQPRRKFEFSVEGKPRAKLATAHLLLILHGLIDAALRSTAAEQDVSVSLAAGADGGGLVLSVRTEGSRLSAPVLAQLDTPPALWSLSMEGEVPFRLVQAGLLARKWGGDVQLFWAEGRLTARAHLPANNG